MKDNRIFHYLMKYKRIFFLVILFAFFPPLSISLLSEQGGIFWKLVDYGVKAAQVLLATAGYVFWFSDRKRNISFWFVGFVVHLCLMAFSGIMNGNTSITTLGSLYANVGFCLLCAGMYTHDQKEFLWTGAVAFSVYTILGVISVYLFPLGFFHSKNTYDAIYGLGAKNNAFPFYFACFFFWNLILMDTDKTKWKWIPVLIIPTVVAGYICQSTNTMICMLLLLVLTLLVLGMERMFCKINPVVVLVAFVAVIALVYTGLESQLLASLLEKFNRTLTFSGRDTLWNQAGIYFNRKPFFGAGSELTFTLANMQTTTHAHSQWLDKLAKFGIIPMVFLVNAVLYTFIRARKSPDRKKANFMCGMLLIYMLHMSFDTYNYNFFTMFIITINMILDKELPETHSWLKSLKK